MTKTAKIVLGIVIVVIVIVIIAVSRGGGSKETGPIKIGFIGPLTGDVSTLGVASKQAVEIATKEINDAGGINGRMLDVTYEDGKCSAEPAASAATKLMSINGVSAIIGGACSGETGAFVKNAMTAKIPVVSYCSSAPTLTNSGKYFFRTHPSDAYVGKFIAQYLYDQGVRKVAVLYHNTDYGTGVKNAFSDSFTKIGGTVTIAEGAQQTDRDYKTLLAKIKATDPEYLLMPMFTEGAIVAIRQSQDLGIKAKIIMADTGSDPKVYKNIPATVELTYVLVKSNLPDTFKSKFNTGTSTVAEIPACAPQAYDTTYVLANAIKNAGGVDGDKIAVELHKTMYEGVSGKISFDEVGDLIGSNYVVWKVKGGVPAMVK